MDITALKTFLAVSECQSYTKAAQQLYITPSAVSKRIAKLELELEEKLFTQIGPVTELTEAGTRLLPFANEIVIASGDAIKSIKELDDKISGTIILGITFFAGLYRLPKILKAFLLKYPNVNFDIRYLFDPDIYLGIENGKIDMAVSTLVPHISPHIHKKKLWREHLYVFVAKTHELATYPQVSKEILSNYSAVLPGLGYVIRDIVEHLFLDENKKLHVKVMNNLEVIQEMIERGLGWSVLPAEFSTPDLVILDIPDFDLNYNYYLVSHKKKKLSTTEKKFIEFFSLIDASSYHNNSF